MQDTLAGTSGRKAKVGKFVALLLKLGVTAACFWYVAHQVDFAAFVRILPRIDPVWIGIAVVGAMLQIPLIGIRWSLILDALPGLRVPRSDAIAITWISVFIAQVLPYGAGDAMRVWLLHRTGTQWRTGLVSVLIDRGIGVAALFAYGFCILLLPSALVATEGYRYGIIIVFGAISAGIIVGLVFVPVMAPVLARLRFTRWIAGIALACYEVLIRSRAGLAVAALALLVHTITIVCIWCVSRALGLPLSLLDAAVLFVLMLGIALIPVSVGGWGLREAAVVTLLSGHGVPAEAALSLSVLYGLVQIGGALPGVAIWAVYSPRQPESLSNAM